MSIPAIQSFSNLNNPISSGLAGTGVAVYQPTQLAAQAESKKPNAQQIISNTAGYIASPLLNRNFIQKQVSNTFETKVQQQQMLETLKQQLAPQELTYLNRIINNGKLFDTQSEDGRSTLHHLHQIANTPRAKGLNNKAILTETLRVLAHPESISQRFSPLSSPIQQHLINYYNSGKGPKLKQPVTPESFMDHSATCVSSSVMYTLFDKQPAEAVRHICGLTSPQQGFWEAASAYDISPDNPYLANQKLKEYGVPGQQVDANNFMVWVSLPYTGLVRGINQQNYRTPDSQGVVESVYQSALTKLAAYNYEPGLGTRVLPDGSLDADPGIEADRKTLMESVMKDNPANIGPVAQVEYQVTAADTQNEPYLMGYTRPFEKTLGDLTRSLDLGSHVIIGIVDTDKDQESQGRLNLKHEVTLVGYKRNPQTGDVTFKIADSDDGIPRLIEKNAKELIPQIHHAGLPMVLGRTVINEMNQLNGRYLLPDQQDAQKFNLVSIVPPQVQPKFIALAQQQIQQQYQLQQLAAQKAYQQVQQPYPAVNNLPIRQFTS